MQGDSDETNPTEVIDLSSARATSPPTGAGSDGASRHVGSGNGDAGHGDTESEGGTRQRIIDAAAEVFLEKGFTGTRVVDIARRAGFTSGALYGYFDSRAELLAEAVARGSSQMLSDLLGGPESDGDSSDGASTGDTDPFSVLEAALDQVAEPIDESDQMLLDGVALAHREPIAGDRLAEALGHFRSQVASTNGTELDPGAADLLVVLVLGITSARALGLHDPLPADLRGRLAKCLSEGAGESVR